ncbi:thioesterase superfamily protein YciA [Thermoclostridium stercorarium subsp. stercorarium DSM 8532]|jgi:acyl-CoA hydrolase|uniref:Thioesterase superfamily protein YciA n=3 Tax=Thermoclostridium stercorarium TaxID=1510 RepID=L7VKX1_THES1|nr:acyl-CoA thioesterase [Thermoclostridium stercorarium]AGC67314.1 thioesterase superfamily protein YciA [Thermoclostridium stercorarium subsp. stercorarium DSM 8532]AGI38376.1 acyl-CoA hydrolase [Thermoclostridium stercorarium subsp. stercorarium DSM 8532]ANW97812.1 acyl-CoA thioesterase [Thermoclostridium stercorarium subsp. thermolacticum DSM 2910]ANX00339.1 acyl-CoA thioesterase [Thermoclostridium stercorarium subsp. leptospartum DSM 9219]UZQ85885.1 acyl-CoA thioesterase [Thermoclostridiu
MKDNERPCKSVQDSIVEMTELVLPNDANILGNLLGGRLMHWIDIAGALTASKHSNCVVVTAALDSLDFKHPIKVGEMVRLKSRITWVGNTSMEVKVEVYGENLLTGEVRKTNEAYLTYVALDRNGNPTQVPMLYLNTDEERKEFEKAVRRREMRLKRKNNPEGES